MPTDENNANKWRKQLAALKEQQGRPGNLRALLELRALMRAALPEDAARVGSVDSRKVLLVREKLTVPAIAVPGTAPHSIREIADAIEGKIWSVALLQFVSDTLHQSVAAWDTNQLRIRETRENLLELKEREDVMSRFLGVLDALNGTSSEEIEI